MSAMIFNSKSEKQTQAFAVKLARHLRKGDCLALVGEFGSGKTTFVKGLAEGLGFRKKHYVSSPSFVILKIYDGRLSIYHFDLYRLSQARDFEEIGWSEFVDGDGVSVIEWADRGRHLLPKGHLRIDFSILGPRERRLCLRSDSPAHGRLFKRLSV